jgi:SAM-dependent methyltransferase
MMMENSVRRKLADEIADFYEIQGASFSSMRGRPWDLSNLVEGRVKSGDFLVDVGAGNGRLLQVLPPGTRYLGIEPSSTLRSEAKKNLANRTGAEVIPGSLPKLDLADGIADAAACLAVLQHVPSREGRVDSILELHRILKPGGVLVCTVWNLRAKRFWSWLTFRFAWLRLTGIEGGEPGDLNYTWKATGQTEYRYVHAFTLSEFKKLFDPALWTIERIGANDKQGWCHWFKGRRLAAIVTKKIMS